MEEKEFSVLRKRGFVFPNDVIVLFCSILLVSRVFCSEDSSQSHMNGREDTVTRHGARTLPDYPHCGSIESGCKLIVSTVLEAPYMMLKSNGALLTGNDRFEGYLADILQRLATSIGLNYEIRLSRGVKHGDDLYFDRFLNGVISEVKSGTAHIGAGPLIVTNSTLEHVDFTQPFLSLRSSALIRKTPVDSLHRPPSNPRNFSTAHRHPFNRDHHSDVITDHLQLLQSNLTYGVIHSGVAYHMMSSSSESLVRTMWSRMATHWPRSFVHSVQEGVERARRGGYAFIIDTPTAEYVASRQPCDLYTTEPFLDVMTYAFVMRKTDFRLRHAIDRELMRLKWGDELQAMFLRWWKSECLLENFSILNASHGTKEEPHVSVGLDESLPPPNGPGNEIKRDAKNGEYLSHSFWSSKAPLVTATAFHLMIFCSVLSL